MTSAKKILALLLSLLLGVGFFSGDTFAKRRKIYRVDEILAEPAKFDDTVVWVRGVVRLEEEGHALYLSFDDAIHRNIEKALALSGPAIRDQKSHRDWNLKPVVIEGRFSSAEKGQFDVFGGMLIGIDKFESPRSR